MKLTLKGPAFSVANRRAVMDGATEVGTLHYHRPRHGWGRQPSFYLFFPNDAGKARRLLHVNGARTVKAALAHAQREVK